MSVFMVNAREFLKLWKRDRQLREQGNFNHDNDAKGWNHTRKQNAFAAIARQRSKIPVDARAKMGG